MKIYFNAEALAKYLFEFRMRIRRENDGDNNSIFNIVPRFFAIDETLANQELMLLEDQLSHNDDQIDFSEKEQDVDFSTNRSSKKDLLISAIDPYIPTDKEEKQHFIDDLDAWKDNKKLSFVSFEECLKDENHTYGKESALFLFPDNRAGHCPYSIISHDDILSNLAKLFFIVNDDKPNLSRTIFTRTLEDWSLLSEAMQYETDIIIVDAFIFEGSGNTFGQNAESLIRAICGGKENETKNVVLFFENTYPSCWLYEFYQRIREDVHCSITFVGVPNKGEKKLHDRYIVSNHRLIFSGHSFSQYFKEERFSAHGSVYLSIGSSADINNEIVIIEALKYLQTEVLIADGVCIYGNENRLTSNLLTTEGLEVNMHKFGAMEIDFIKKYTFQTKVEPRWDSSLNVWYWTDIQIAGKKDSNLEGKLVRLFDIEKNENPRNKGKYPWFAKYKRLNNQ